MTIYSLFCVEKVIWRRGNIVSLPCSNSVGSWHRAWNHTFTCGTRYYWIIEVVGLRYVEFVSGERNDPKKKHVPRLSLSLGIRYSQPSCDWLNCLMLNLLDELSDSVTDMLVFLRIVRGRMIHSRVSTAHKGALFSTFGILMLHWFRIIKVMNPFLAVHEKWFYLVLMAILGNVVHSNYTGLWIIPKYDCT